MNRFDLDARGDSGQSQQVLMFGLNYWPEQTGIAPYSTGLAEHLASSGAKVTVVAGMPYYPQWRVAAEYRGHRSVRETVHGVTVIRYRQYVPSRQSAWQRAMFEGTFLLHGLLALRLPRPDVVLGIVPNLAGGVLAALAARRYRAPYGLIFQDLVGQAASQSGIAGGGQVAKVTSAAEGWAAHGAAGVAIVAESFREHIERMGVEAGRIQMLSNWAHVSAPCVPREQVRARFGWPPDATVVLHAGNMGLKQGLDQVVTAARLAAERHPSFRFVLVGDGNQRAALEAVASDLPNVEFLDPQPAEWFPEMLHAADVLLVTQRASVTDMSLPSKLTSYFVAGRPVVAAVAAGSATERAVRESGAGLVVDAEDSTALLGAIDRLANDRELSTQLAAAGPRFAKEHLRSADSLAQAAEFVRGLMRAAALDERHTDAVSRGAA